MNSFTLLSAAGQDKEVKVYLGGGRTLERYRISDSREALSDSFT